MQFLPHKRIVGDIRDPRAYCIWWGSIKNISLITFRSFDIEHLKIHIFDFTEIQVCYGFSLNCRLSEFVINPKNYNPYKVF